MEKRTKILITLASLGVICFLLYSLRQVLAPVFFSLILAYFLDPAIDKLEARNINRTLSIFVFLAGSFVAFGLLILLIIPLMQYEVSNLLENLPTYTADIREAILPYMEKVVGQKVPGTMSDTIDKIVAAVKEAPPELIKPLSAFLKSAFSSTLTLIFWFISLLLVPVFTFYFLRDFDFIKAKALELVPTAYKDYIKDRFAKVDEVLASFIRGQMILCTVLAVLYTAGLLIVGIDMAIVIGVLSGYLFIIPYVGTILGAICAVIMALLKFHDIMHVLAVLAVFGVVQLIEGYLLTPKIVGEKVGLNPVMVILAILIGGSLFGVLGILLAVPVTAVTKVFFVDLLDWYKKSEYYLEEG